MTEEKIASFRLHGRFADGYFRHSIGETLVEGSVAAIRVLLSAKLAVYSYSCSGDVSTLRELIYLCDLSDYEETVDSEGLVVFVSKTDPDGRFILVAKGQNEIREALGLPLEESAA